MLLALLLALLTFLCRIASVAGGFLLHFDRIVGRSEKVENALVETSFLQVLRVALAGETHRFVAWLAINRWGDFSKFELPVLSLMRRFWRTGIVMLLSRIQACQERALGRTQHTQRYDFCAKDWVGLLKVATQCWANNRSGHSAHPELVTGAGSWIPA